MTANHETQLLAVLTAAADVIDLLLANTVSEADYDAMPTKGQAVLGRWAELREIFPPSYRERSEIIDTAQVIGLFEERGRRHQAGRDG